MVFLLSFKLKLKEGESRSFTSQDLMIYRKTGQLDNVCFKYLKCKRVLRDCRNTSFKNYFSYQLSNFLSDKRKFEDDLSANIAST